MDDGNIKPKSVKDLDRLISEQEFDEMQSMEYRLTKMITPDMIEVDPRVWDTCDTTIGQVPRRVSPYTKEERIRACIVYTCTGSLAKTHHLTGYDRSTIVLWRTQNWWGIVKKQIDTIRNEILESKLTDIIEEATDQMLDRIKNGDHIVNNITGEIHRVPCKLKDLADGGVKLSFDKREEIRGNKSPSSQTQQEILESLKRTALAFEETSRQILQQQKTKIENLDKVETLEGTFKEIENV